MSAFQIPGLTATTWRGIPLLLFAAALFLSACAPVQRVPEMALDTPAAAWAAFKAKTGSTGKNVPFSLSASLYLTSSHKTNRTSLTLWGTPAYPLRMDIHAGIGTALAFFREDESGWLAFYPQNGEADYTSSPRKALTAMGVDIPFSLRDLALILSGRIAETVPAGFSASEVTEKGNFRYVFADQKRFSELVLDRRGHPVSLSGRGKDSWTARFVRYGEDGSGRPEKIEMELPPHSRIKIFVKKFEEKAAPWPPEAMDLKLPDGVQPSGMPE